MIGITFRGKHSYNDYGLILNSFRDLGASKKIIRADVPFMHGSYDFSTVGSNGENVYTDRALEAKFTYMGYSKQDIRAKADQVVMWLLDSPLSELVDDRQKDLRYMAVVEEYPAKEEQGLDLILTVTFTAKPFKQGINFVGEEEWDTFNFDNDYMQSKLYFEVSSSRVVKIYNPGRTITPVMIASSPMEVTANDYTSSLIAGSNTDTNLKLVTGANSVKINGTGAILFQFRKEVI